MQAKLLTLGALLGMALMLTQCQTLTLDMRKSGTLPRIELEGVMFHEIEEACTEVFGAEDFRKAGVRGTRLLYERPGSTMDFLTWGGLRTDEKILVRLAIHMRQLGADAFEVECQPFIVTSAGGHMEAARKISRLSSGKYQKLMDQVKERVTNARNPYGSLEGLEAPSPASDSWY